MIKYFFLINIFFLFFLNNRVSKAQEVADTLNTIPPVAVEEPEAPVAETDTAFDENRIPRRRALMSAILPGLGQAANQKYWKIPIIYGGAVVLGYLIKTNHDQFIVFRNSVEQQRHTPNDYPMQDIYNPDGLRVQRDYYRRNRDLFIIVGSLVYILNIVDAYVDAHLREFDLNDDLALQVKPAILNNYSYFCPGLTLNLNFKK